MFPVQGLPLLAGWFVRVESLVRYRLPTLKTVPGREVLVIHRVQPGFYRWHVRTGWTRPEDSYAQSTLNLILSFSDSFVRTEGSLSLCSSVYQKVDTLSVS